MATIYWEGLQIENALFQNRISIKLRCCSYRLLFECDYYLRCGYLQIATVHALVGVSFSLVLLSCSYNGDHVADVASTTCDGSYAVWISQVQRSVSVRFTINISLAYLRLAVIQHLHQLWNIQYCRYRVTNALVWIRYLNVELGSI